MRDCRLRIEKCRLEIGGSHVAEATRDSAVRAPFSPGTCARRRGPSRGLSTLELVLALPILLSVMALIISYGTVAGWKVRALGAARHSGWANRWPRHWPQPQPQGDLDSAWGVLADENRWRRVPSQTASTGLGGGDIAALDDPRINQPVVRGPLPYGTAVNHELFNPIHGRLEGASDVANDFPILAKELGKYHVRAHNPLLDNKWQYQRMNWPPPHPPWRDGWWGGNVHRRIPVIWDLARTDPSLPQAFFQALMAMLRAPDRPNLRPLDNDEEFLAWTARFPLRFGLRPWAPNFIRHLSFLCSLEPDQVRQQVDNLIDRIQGKVVRDAQGRIVSRIQGLPEDMARRYVGLYNAVIQELQNEAAADPARTAQNQADIASLQSKIQVLTTFLNSLP